MADISMCWRADCPLFEKCYRAQAKPCEYRQSYGHFEPEGCVHFWPMRKDDTE